MVSQNPLMLSKYRYHLLLYSIPRLKSTDVVSSIYQLKNPIETLLKTMVEKKILYTKANEMTKEKVNRIASVGKKIDVYKRPYLFIVK
jgi:hypothetical protein